MSAGYGVCVYRKNDDGSLDATWHASDLPRDVPSKGLAVHKSNDHTDGSCGDGFSGEYVVTYTDPDGVVEAVRDLRIMCEGEIYALQWLLDGKIVCTGIGFENNEGLIVSYIDV